MSHQSDPIPSVPARADAATATAGSARGRSAAARAPGRAPRRGRVTLLLILAVCAAPAIVSYLLYYVLPPTGRTNFGTLIEPQRPVGATVVSTQAGESLRLDSLRGRWVVLQADRGACDRRCVDKLYAMRQQRAMTGKERDRIERVWLITDAAPVAAEIGTAYEGTLMLRADPAALAALLPAEPGRGIEDYLYVVDPLGNLMMRFPHDGDPSSIRKDIARLLKASRIG